MNNQDMISRSALLKRLELVDMEKSTDFRAGVQFGVEHAIDVVKEVPAADVAPVVHGKWMGIIESKLDTHTGEYWEEVYYNCLNCDYATDSNTNYCPNCGADMRERKGDDG